MKFVFWAALALLVYTWMGYPLFLLAASRLRPSRRGRGGAESACTVTVLVAARNEAENIVARIENILDSDYAAGLLDVVVVSDGSTDGTDEAVSELARRDRRITLVRGAGEGKSLAQNTAMPHARGEIVVLTDADTVYERDTVKNLVSNFDDDRVGCATGTIVLKNDGGTSVSRGQGVYWRFELLLRRLESRAGTLHTASGPVMAFRKGLFRPMDARYGDDCVIPLDVLLQGYDVVHDDDAVAYDAFPSTTTGELRARTRMTLRNITGTLSRRGLLNPLSHPMLAHAIFFHKICRWLNPYFMLLLFASNAAVLTAGAGYRASFVVQAAFYAAAVVGFGADALRLSVPVASQAFSFMVANTGFFIGVLKAMSGESITRYSNRKANP